MKQISLIFTRLWNLAAFSEAELGPLPGKLLFWVQLLRGVILALTAGIVLWLVRQPVLAPVLATIAVTLVRGKMTGWRDKFTAWRLLSLYFPTLGGNVTKTAELQFQTLLMGGAMLIRPLLIYFLLCSVAWYWLIPVSVLAGAFALELLPPKEPLKPWLPAIISTAVVMIFARIFDGGVMLSAGVLTCIVIYLLAGWMKRTTGKPTKRNEAMYLGELAVTILLLISVIF